ncbi:MAG: isochorismate synthase [Candidatus Margulisbacteria bacterium]|nr:isochorismate synthase [Candidatus Margulisiibacteriota bacterium]
MPVRHETPLDEAHIDLYAWIESHPHPQKTIWSQPNHFLSVSIGISEELIGHTPEEHHQILKKIKEKTAGQGSRFRYYGGTAFSPESIDYGFPYCRYILPEQELLYENGHYYLIHYTPGIQLEPTLPPTGQKPPTIAPNFKTWEKLVQTIKSETALKKVVLARKISRACNGSLQTFLEKNQTGFGFLFQRYSHTTFLGISPETLFSKIGQALTTDAIAGTRKRGNTQEEDHQLAQELLSSKKDQEELNYVKTHIQHHLSPLCETLTIPDSPKILKLPHVQHLHYAITGTLKKTTSDHDLFSALHPTPAICGTPTDLAKEFIHTNEPFKRGWYSGTVGWISEHQSQYVVAIRSAHFQDQTQHIFSGAGILNASDPKSEWTELDNKIRQWGF